MRVTKPIDVAQLQDELTAASVQYRVLALVPTESGTPHEADIWDHGEDGFPIELVPEAVPIVEAHVPILPIFRFTQGSEVWAKVVTVNANPTELYRVTLKPDTGYDVTIRLIAVDAVNYAVKKLVIDLTVKRFGGGPVQVGNNTILVNHPEPASSSWTGGATFEGNDIVIRVTGALGRTIDWAMLANVNRFTPGGDA